MTREPGAARGEAREPAGRSRARSRDRFATWLLSALCLAFVGFAVAQHRHAWLPAYHDASLHWASARVFFTRPWFPFVTVGDTGHPPLVAWTLAALWHLPLPRLLSAHLLAWAAAALLVASVFDIGRRAFGVGAGVAAALLLAMHPVIQGQALQLNLDLFQVAFAWAAVAGAVAGRPAVIAVALTASCMTKLNGPFAVPPLALWAAVRLGREGGWRQPRRVLEAAWPVAIPAAVFVAYHAVKLRATGHFLVGPEFREENLGFVNGAGEYLVRLAHSLRQLSGFPNPNLWIVAVTGLLLVIVVVRLRDREYRRAARSLLASPPPSLALSPSKTPADAAAPARVFRPLTAGETLALSWLVAALHVGFWTIRQYFGLVRHFMGAYPAFCLTVVAAALLVAPWRPRRRAALVAMTATVVPLVLATFLAGHPRRGAALPPRLAELFVFPPDGILTNHENSMEIVDELEAARQAIRGVADRFPPGTTVDAPWPFETFFRDPDHGLVGAPYLPRPGDAQVLFIPGCAHPGREPSEVPPPPGYQLLEVARRGRAWDAVYARR